MVKRDLLQQEHVELFDLKGSYGEIRRLIVAYDLIA